MSEEKLTVSTVVELPFHGYGVTVDFDNNIIAVDNSTHIWKVDAETNGLTKLTGTAGQGFKDGDLASAQFVKPYDVTIDASGALIVGDSGNGRIRKVAVEDDAVTTVAG